ncbi:MAG: monofunctional biosynthetic peptidoglycan transglycosylase [Elusimicrobiota bacterium]
MRKKIIFIIALVILLPPLWYLTHLPKTSELKTTNPKTSAIRIYREEQKIKKGKKPHSSMQWRNLKDISPYLIHAVILAEDDTFYRHHGFDFEQLKKAFQENWKRKRFAFGASTITQQLARTLYLSSHKNLLRKAKEALITRRLEKTLPKYRILELYLNVVEWGPEIYGAEAASQHHFGKSSIALTANEAIALAAILPSPRKWNPMKENGFMGRRKSILYERMVRAHHIVSEVEVEESTGSVVSPGSEELPTDEIGESIKE